MYGMGGTIMKKWFIFLVLITSIIFSGCGNKQFFDTKYTFTKAKIYIGNEKLEVNVKSWMDYGDGDTSVQIITDDGIVYWTDIKNVLMIGN
jgi:hypothetical protein